MLIVRLVVPRGRRRGADPAGDRRARGRRTSPAERRPAAYGLVAAAGAVAVAVGPLIGGFCTTYFSWRWVFAGEVLIVIVILVLARRIADEPPGVRPKLDFVGVVLSASGLALARLRRAASRATWGWIQPKAGAPVVGRPVADDLADPRRACSCSGCSSAGRARRERDGRSRWSRAGDAAQPPAHRRADDVLLPVLRAGGRLLRRAAVPLGLPRPVGDRDRACACCRSRSRCCSAAVGIPQLCPNAIPRRVVRLGAARDARRRRRAARRARRRTRRAEIVTVPLLLLGLGIGALASQLGARDRLGGARRARAPRSAACRTRPRTSAPRSAPRSPGSVLIATLTTVVPDGHPAEPGRSRTG